MNIFGIRTILVSCSFAAIGLACSVQTHPTEGSDSLLSQGDGAAPLGDGGRAPDAAATLPDASTPPPRPACYDDAMPFSGHQFQSPSLHQNVCSLAQREAFRDACLGNRKSAACLALRQAEASCGKCIFGPSGPGPEASTAPMGVFLFGNDTPGAQTINTQGCAALVGGWPGCAWPNAMLQTCIETKCSACTSDGDKAACRVHAEYDACAGNRMANCAMTSGRWIQGCERATPAETFMRVAEVFCGAP